LKFGRYFNQSFKKNVLPHSITHLTFGDCYHKLLKKNIFPNSLVKLKFSKLCKHTKFIAKELENTKVVLEFDEQ